MQNLRYVLFVRASQCCCNREDEEYAHHDKRHESMFSLTDCTNNKGQTSQSVDLETSGQRVLKLLLEVRDSDALQVGRTYHITPSGLKDSSRELIDGKTIIGSDPGLCDIVAAPSDRRIGRAHCCIQFDSKKKCFKIQDLGDGDGTFMKIEDNLILQHGDIVSFGETHVGIVIKNTPTESTISLQFYEGPKANTEMTFHASDDVIRIGRMRDCAVIIEDNILSRYQCFICYHENSGWVLTDGDGNIRSANGTW